MLSKKLEIWVWEKTPTPEPDFPTPQTARHPTPEAWSAKSLSLDIVTVKEPTPPISPLTARNPSMDLESTHYLTTTPLISKEITRN